MWKFCIRRIYVSETGFCLLFCLFLRVRGGQDRSKSPPCWWFVSLLQLLKLCSQYGIDFDFIYKVNKSMIVRRPECLFNAYLILLLKSVMSWNISAIILLIICQMIKICNSTATLLQHGLQRQRETAASASTIQCTSKMFINVINVWLIRTHHVNTSQLFDSKCDKSFSYSCK